MKKIVAFLLVLAIALGGMVWTHAAITARQDDLTIYPTTEVGDPSVLEGRSVSLTIGCGEHLRWQTDYPFGGEARTEFSYSRKPHQTPHLFRHQRSGRLVQRRHQFLRLRRQLPPGRRIRRAPECRGPGDPRE